MARFADMRGLIAPLVLIVAVTGVAFGLNRNEPEPPPSLPLAPLDSAAPTQLSTATFGMG
jgi:hypothetical protein